MKKNLEIEFKNILSESEYQKLYALFNFTSKEANNQVNIYFDTLNHALETKKTALRLRKTEKYNHLTIKQPLMENQTLETTLKLTAEISDQIEKEGKMPETAEINAMLNQLGIRAADLIVIGKFKTTRHESNWRNSLIVLDNVEFEHFNDYELEMETADFNQGKIDFENFLAHFNIKQRPSAQKVIRMRKNEPLYKFNNE